MRRMISISVVSLAMVAFSGCLGGRPIRYYTADSPPAPISSTHRLPVALLVGHIGSPEILEDEPIAYRSGADVIGTYRYHLWIEPPAEMVKIMLIRRLRDSGRYQSVTELGSLARGKYVVQGRLYDFEEVDKGKSVTALVSMEFELFNRKSHKEVWNHFYSHTAQVGGKRISDVVAALNHNLEQGLTEVISSLNSYFSSKVRQKS